MENRTEYYAKQIADSATYSVIIIGIILLTSVSFMQMLIHLASAQSC